MADTLIKVEHVSKKFCRDLKRSLWYGMSDITAGVFGRNAGTTLRKDEFWAVRDVSFEVKRGECLGLIGHNGAGKSTLLKMLNGLIRPDEGRIEMHGKIGALIELGAGFSPVLTGRENVYNNGAVLGFSKAEIDRKFDDIVAFAELEEFIDMPVQNYSSGMKVRLGFAVASQMEPDILIIDEVLAVGDVGFQIKCFNVIQEISKRSAVILVSHTMPNIARTANMVCLLKGGKIDFLGRNLNEGITKYFSSFSGEKYHVTGNVTSIKNLKILEENTNEEISLGSSITPFTSIKLKYEIDLSEFEIGTYKVVYVFYDQTLRQIAQFIPENFQILANNGIEEVEVILERLNLCSSKFNLGIAYYKLVEGRLYIYTFHENIICINFNSLDNVTNAIVAIEGSQKVSKINIEQ
jgi:lipopolysaccharide transport system ATP-binding protein